MNALAPIGRLAPIRAASLCSGIGAPETALPEWDWVWCSEIEPYPCRVLAHHFPHTVNLGDMTADDFAVRACALGPIDVLIAGTPCQDFSIAGLRAGLRGARGNLTLRALEIYEDACDAARSAGQPEPLYWWENVPGVLSDKGNAFGNLLAGLAGCASALVPPDGCRWTDAGLVAGPRRAVAWRVLDAQYFGLAQRRERVFVVAGPLDGADPAEILFEPEGMQGNPAPRRGAQEDIARPLAAGSARGSGYRNDADTAENLIVSALTASGVGTCGADDNQAVAGHLLAFGGNNCSGPIEVAAALNAHAGGSRMDFESETFVCATLDASFGRLQGCSGQDANHGHSHLVVGAICRDSFSGGAGGRPEGAAAGHFVPVAFDCKTSGQHGFGVGEITSTLRAMGAAGSQQNGGGHLAVADHLGVRRLMPVECERLQGFPDGHTDVPAGNKPAADGPRYKSLGNSMAVTVIRWIGLRIQRARQQVAAIAAE